LFLLPGTVSIGRCLSVVTHVCEGCPSSLRISRWMQSVLLRQFDRCQQNPLWKEALQSHWPPRQRLDAGAKKERLPRVHTSRFLAGESIATQVLTPT
jgi:hypothetical protein